MDMNQYAEENQEDISARLALISMAVEKKLHNKQPVIPVAGETFAQGSDAFVVSVCPIDPMERLLCESCQ